MTAIRSPHSKVLAHLLGEHREKLVGALVMGAPSDHAAYRQIVGQIQGITDALNLSEEADFKLSGDESDGA